MSTGRFHATPVTPIKGAKGSMMPRNSSAPHFVDTRHVMPRITSTPGFGRLTRLNSNEPNGLGSQDHVNIISQFIAILGAFINVVMQIAGRG